MPQQINYFKDCINVQEIKAQYRKLCFMYHPDVSQIDNAHDIMVVVNEQYHQALNGQHETQWQDQTGKAHTYYYNAETEQHLMDKINELLAAKMEGITIDLIGFWIWAGGDTRKHKETLKSLKLRWHSGRKLWYWKGIKGKTKYAKNLSIDDLKQSYGSKRYQSDSDNLNTAMAM